MPNRHYGLINDLRLISPLVELFRDIFHPFLKSLIVRADAPVAKCMTVWDILAAKRRMTT